MIGDENRLVLLALVSFEKRKLYVGYILSKLIHGRIDSSALLGRVNFNGLNRSSRNFISTKLDQCRCNYELFYPYS